VVEAALGECTPAEKKVERFFPIPRHPNDVGEVFLLQLVESQFDILGVVFDEENLRIILSHGLPPESIRVSGHGSI
jgi:hypothetical protein